MSGGMGRQGWEWALEHLPPHPAPERGLRDQQRPDGPGPLSELRVVRKLGHSPLLRLHVHHQGDVALNEGEGEEADMATVLPGSHGVFHSGGQGVGR